MSDSIRLPESWAECCLGDVVEYGVAPKVAPDEIPPSAWVLELEDIERNTSKLLQRITATERESKSTKAQFDEGDVLLSKLRPYLNKVLLADQGGYCTTEIVPISPSGVVTGKYLFYALKRPAFVQYADAESHGLSMPRLGTDAAKAAPFILAPLNEQERITTKLDVLVGRINACRARIDRVPALISRFRQAVITAAVTGELTADWRVSQIQTPALARQRRTLADICAPGRSITYGVIKLGRVVTGGVPCLRTSNVRWLKIETEAVKQISPTISAEHARTVLKGGEVLVNVRGTLGGVAVASDDMAGWNVSREIAVVPVDPTVGIAAYIAYWIGSKQSQRWLSRVERGVAYVGINLEDLRQLPVELPTMAEQQEIVRRVEALFGYSDHLEGRYRVMRAIMDRMTPASIAKAFRGELVPQDPTDEPGHELLARYSRVTRPDRTGRHEPRSRPKMMRLSVEMVRGVISEMPDQFTFDDLRNRVPGEYDELARIVFSLLNEDRPVIIQVFDPEIRAMRFEGGKP